MLSGHNERRIWRFLPLILLLVASLATAGVAMAAFPASHSYAPPAPANNGKVGLGLPTSSLNSGSVAPAKLPVPAAPDAVLYDQYDNASTNGTSSQEFPDFPTYTDQTADDFMVSAGENWSVTEVDMQGQYSLGGGPAPAFNVYFYEASGTLPGTPVYTATMLPYTGGPTDFVIPLTTPALLNSGGHYWVSVQAANMPFGTLGQWYWEDRTVQSGDPAVFRNPGGGFGCNPTWAPKAPCVATTAPDQVYRLVGEVVPLETPTPTETETPTVPPIPTDTETPVVTATPTHCGIDFTDVPPGSTFYPYIRCLSCRGIISGYDDGTFRPSIPITRAQIAKIVSLASGITQFTGPQVFEDVPPESPFYTYVQALFYDDVMGGYPCGLRPTEPCVPPNYRGYFRTSDYATRGQLSKIVSNAAGFGEVYQNWYYYDVPQGSTFYVFIMRLTTRGVMSGYPCGTVPEEPCDSQNRPYFRPGATVTRGQAAKIVANTFFPDCNTPLK